MAGKQRLGKDDSPGGCLTTIPVDTGARGQAEAGLSGTALKYRALMESIDQGFCIIQMIFDDDGVARDYIFLETNPAFESQSHLPDVMGKRMRQVEPRTEQRWYDMYGGVALSGVAKRFVDYTNYPGDRWYDVFAFPVGWSEEQKVGVLFSDITQQKLNEAALLESRTQLADEVDVLRRLHQMTMRVMAAPDIQSALDEVLDASLTLLQAEFGVIQLLDPHSGLLRVVANAGFDPVVVEMFSNVAASAGSAGERALKRGRRIVVEDVDKDPLYLPYRDIARRTGISAAQSTPLITHNGEIVGILANHFRQPTTLSKRDERLLDLMGRQAAELLEHLQMEEMLEARVQERTEQVRKLASELTLAEQEERDRIARILHDDLQQRLYAAQIQLSMVAAAFVEGDKMLFEHMLAEITDTLAGSIGIARQLNVDLSPAVLNGDGLTEAICWLAGQMGEQHRLGVTVEATQSFPIPEQSLRVLLFQSVRELLFNVVKHANAEQATVRLQQENGQVRIVVQDHGDGFAAEQPFSGSGLANMRYRLTLAGGDLQVQSAPGQGTTAVIVAPLQL